MPREHWTKRMRRENAELKAENEQLVEDLTQTQKEVGKLRSELDRNPRENPDVVANGPDGLIVSLTNSDVNDIREVHNAQSIVATDPDRTAELTMLTADEVEIRVYSREDIDKYLPLTESQGIVDHVNPPPSWNRATEIAREWFERHNNLQGTRIFVFDPYGFMRQFNDLNIVKTYTSHEHWRTQEGLEALENADIDRQIAETEESLMESGWHIFMDIADTFVEGKSVKDLYDNAFTGFEKSGVLKQVGKAFDPPVGVQLSGNDGQLSKMMFSVPSEKGQATTMQFKGKLPGYIGKRFMIRDVVDRNVSSSGDPEGATIEFVEN